ncbi:MAG: DUF2520 domain-containing protein [Candidatus Kapaibacterium sp.]|nr:MAG: DUF2520 domain-containing protein [Candidatus Kapabacteria bacterium]
MSMQSYGVIGLGKLGLSIAVSLSAQGRLAWTMNRGAENRNAAKFLLSPSVPMYSSIQAIPALPQTLILAVSDGALEEVSEQLAAKFGNALSDTMLIHCSGVKTRSVLAACEAQGAFTIGAHPYQTFGVATAKNFKDIAWGVELPPNEPYTTISEQAAKEMIQTLGGRMNILSAETIENKPLYHVSAIFASNYISVLVGYAAQAAREAGISPEQFLPQILHKSLENALSGLKQTGTKYPLTGPISRGDVAAIQHHIDSLRTSANGRSMIRPYCLYALATADFACTQGFISKEHHLALRETLQNVIDEMQ